MAIPVSLLPISVKSLSKIVRDRMLGKCLEGGFVAALVLQVQSIYAQ